MTRKKVDANQHEIVAEYRKLGCSVYSCAPMGKGFPDLVVGLFGRFNDLVECKDGSLPPSARKLTPDQVKFFEEWKGPVRIVTCREDVIEHYEERSAQYYE